MNLNDNKQMTDFDRERLEREGWKRQTLTDEPRLSELVELYESMSYEVLLVPFDPKAEEAECTACFDDPDRYKIIYTRKKK